MKLINEMLLLEEDTNVAEIRAALEKYCSKYLKRHAADEAFLIRGMKVPSPSTRLEKNGVTDIYKMATHDTRNPRDSFVTVQAGWDDFFLKTFGKKFRSENVAFCYSTNSRKSAPADYGPTFIVIPCGNDYQMCYSGRVKDFYEEFDPSRVWHEDMKEFFFDDKKNYETCMSIAGIEKFIHTDIDESLADDLPDDLSDDDLLDDDLSGKIENILKSLFVIIYKLLISDNLSKTNISKHVSEITFFKKEDVDEITQQLFEKAPLIVHQMMISAGYKVGDFSLDSIERRSEIMLNCKEYLAIPISLKNEIEKAMKLINN